VNLFKTSFYSSIATAISFISGFIVTKVVAVKIGPEGMAYLGQFQNTTAILTMFATGAIASGVIKYLAQYRNEPEKRQQIITTATFIVLIFSFLVSLIVVITSSLLSKIVFKSNEFWPVYLIFGLLLSTVAFNVIFGAILNGLNQVKQLTLINTLGSLIGIGITVFFAYYFGVKGVLLSSTILSVVIFCMYLFTLRRLGVVWRPSIRRPDSKILKMLGGFTLMAVVSGLLVPAIQISIRDRIINQFTIQEAGYWQAVVKISDYYLSFITLVLAVYYVPKLSEIQDRLLLRKEIVFAYKIIVPAVSIIAFLVWLCRDLIIKILFTKEFAPMKSLFTFQLLGDVLKIGSWLLATIMIAKAMTRIYIITEFIFAAIYIMLSYYCIDRFGLIGATYAFCANYAFYWICMVFIMKKHF
jgi:polysaccharide transporter, PST family